MSARQTCLRRASVLGLEVKSEDGVITATAAQGKVISVQVNGRRDWREEVYHLRETSWAKMLNKLEKAKHCNPTKP